MTQKMEDRKGCAVLKIQGPMTINEAKSIRDEMLGCFENYNGLILDLNDLSDLDTAGIQLICSARLTAQEKGKVFKVEGAPMNSMDTLVRAGFNPDAVLCPVGLK